MKALKDSTDPKDGEEFKDSSSRRRRMAAGPVLGVVALAVFAAGLALLLIGLAGIALLVAGLLSWLHPVDPASAWARTLGGIGLVSASTGLAALGWLGLERLPGPLADYARLRSRTRRAASEGDASESEASRGETARERARKFIAVIGILLALICLPFAAAIRAGSPGPWLEWGGPSPGRIICTPGNPAPLCRVSRPHSSQP